MEAICAWVGSAPNTVSRSTVGIPDLPSRYLV